MYTFYLSSYCSLRLPNLSTYYVHPFWAVFLCGSLFASENKLLLPLQTDVIMVGCYLYPFIKNEHTGLALPALTIAFENAEKSEIVSAHPRFSFMQHVKKSRAAEDPSVLKYVESSPLVQRSVDLLQESMKHKEFDAPIGPELREHESIVAAYRKIAGLGYPMYEKKITAFIGELYLLFLEEEEKARKICDAPLVKEQKWQIILKSVAGLVQQIMGCGILIFIIWHVFKKVGKLSSSLLVSPVNKVVLK